MLPDDAPGNAERDERPRTPAEQHQRHDADPDAEACPEPQVGGGGGDDDRGPVVDREVGGIHEET